MSTVSPLDLCIFGLCNVDSVPIDQVFGQLKLYMRCRGTSFPVLHFTVTVIHPVVQGLDREKWDTLEY